MRVRRRKGAIVVAQNGFEAHAVDRLKQRGFRVTFPRVQVLRVLGLSDRPLTPYAIHQEILASGAKVDVVSVYRVLEALAGLGLVHHIGLTDGYMACRMPETHEDEAEHVVCAECGRVTELALPQSILQAAAAQLGSLGFTARQTRLEILAVCPDCSR